MKPAPLRIPRGKAVNVDGKVATGEWDGAESVQIAVGPDWKIQVRFKHDNENLYFLFEGVRHGSRRLFPEIFIDPRNLKSTGWEKGRWWLHVSYNLCEGDGKPNVYTKAGVFQCAHQKSGWDGNNQPEAETQDPEIRVSFSNIRIMPTSEFRLGLALAVTDATGDAHQKCFSWPPKADIKVPRTWGEGLPRITAMSGSLLTSESMEHQSPPTWGAGGSFPLQYFQ